VVVWFRYNAELSATLDRLGANKISAEGITGMTKLNRRQEIMDAFRMNQVRVLLLQLKVGKFGLNLSTASTAIYFSNSYDMEDRAQSEERILDPRKTEPLLYIDLLTENSVDEAVYQILREKKVSSKFFMAELIRKWRER
jgi:SNF2 family DNA or RNA helicase